MYRLSYKGLTLITGVGRVTNVDELIEMLRKNNEYEGFFQPLRYGSIVTPRHGFYIAYKSWILRGRRIRRPSAIAMCLAAGITQVREATEIVGISKGLVQFVAVNSSIPIETINDWPKEGDVERIHGTSDEKEILEKTALTALQLY